MSAPTCPLMVVTLTDPAAVRALQCSLDGAPARVTTHRPPPVDRCDPGLPDYVSADLRKRMAAELER